MRALERPVLRAVRALDAGCHKLFAWRFNPLHQSGALASWLLLILIATGLYLLLLYRVGTPWASVQVIQNQWWLGRWMRGIHRLASDLLIVAAVIHAARMFAQARSWGPRALAWMSGVFLVLLAFVSGWTGFVLVWDRFGAALALTGARLLDALPILSEPVTRVFAGDRPVPSAFFFINLFLHIAIPLGMGAALWLHISRVARPALLPPKALAWGTLAVLFATVVLFPIPLLDEYSPFAALDRVPSDLFYGFWMPVVRALPPALGWVGAVATLVIAMAVPRFTKRPRVGSWAPSAVDPESCTGCNQCPQDCPWDAITMVPRQGNEDGRRSALVGLVDPDRCVSCGVCAGSCPPMGVGPTGRTGRDQMARIRQFVSESIHPRPGTVVAIACENADPAQLTLLTHEGATLHPVSCTGNVHSSVVELALRGGAAGVMLFSCPPRDCRGREGPRWLHERLFNDREAELQERVDKRRVATCTMAVGRPDETLAAFRAFRDRVHALELLPHEGLDVPEIECTPIPVVDSR